MFKVFYCVEFKDGSIIDYYDEKPSPLRPKIDAKSFSVFGWQVEVDRTKGPATVSVVGMTAEPYHGVFTGVLTGTLLLGIDRGRARAVFLNDIGKNEQYLIDKYGINNFDRSGVNGEYAYNWKTDTHDRTWDYAVRVSDGRVDATMDPRNIIVYRVDEATWTITVSHHNNGRGPYYNVTLHAEEVTDDVVRSVDDFFQRNELRDATCIAKNWQKFVNCQNSEGDAG